MWITNQKHNLLIRSQCYILHLYIFSFILAVFLWDNPITGLNLNGSVVLLYRSLKHISSDRKGLCLGNRTLQCLPIITDFIWVCSRRYILWLKHMACLKQITVPDTIIQLQPCLFGNPEKDHTDSQRMNLSWLSVSYMYHEKQLSFP